ncbi:MAG TPA: hypothetical protein VHY35_11670 [Stellaceae bacterium]|jgi:hypothetical protein|nr:hypothetical protein [Stellaceae bacterium]
MPHSSATIPAVASKIVHVAGDSGALFTRLGAALAREPAPLP